RYCMGHASALSVALPSSNSRDWESVFLAGSVALVWDMLGLTGYRHDKRCRLTGWAAVARRRPEPDRGAVGWVCVKLTSAMQRINPFSRNGVGEGQVEGYP